jgi:hypothetical protein
MKTRKTMFGIMALCAIVTIAITACGGSEDSHTHQWGEYEVTTPATVTAEGEETSTCAACGEKQTRPIPKLVSCNCEATYGATAHLGIDETCTCPATVKPCGCTEQTASLDGIPIRKQAGITVAQMNTAVGNIEGAYNGADYGLDAADKSVLKSKVTEIHVISGTDIVFEGTVLSIGYEADEYDIAYAYFFDVIYAE